MHHSAKLLIGIMLAGPPVFGEAAPSDSQSIQSLLAEVRTLREDLRAGILIAHRMQIVLYRLRIQEVAVARASEKAEQFRNQIEQMEASKKMMAGNIQRLEERFSSTLDSAERKMIEMQLASLKSTLEGWGTEMPSLQANESEAAGKLRAEQEKLTELEDSLEKLDRWPESLRAR